MPTTSFASTFFRNSFLGAPLEHKRIVPFEFQVCRNYGLSCALIISQWVSHLTIFYPINYLHRCKFHFVLKLYMFSLLRQMVLLIHISSTNEDLILSFIIIIYNRINETDSSKVIIPQPCPTALSHSWDFLFAINPTLSAQLKMPLLYCPLNIQLYNNISHKLIKSQLCPNTVPRRS